MDNKFGKISRISACAALKDGKTILEDLSFTAPYKIMMPFEKENGGIQIMPLCASAGIMAGDSQEFSYHVKEGADLEVLSQSFEKNPQNGRRLSHPNHRSAGRQKRHIILLSPASYSFRAVSV